MLRIAVPNKGALATAASEMLGEAGYRRRHDQRDLTVLDPTNDVEFFFLRPKDIAVYVGSGELDLGIAGSTFRYAAPADAGFTSVADLAGKRLATAYPRLAGDDLARHGVEATVIRLDGAVEISVQLGVADAVADVVDSGRTLRQHGLVVFGDPVCVSEAVLIEGGNTAESAAKTQLTERLRGVVFAQNYLMLDYDCPRSLLDKAIEVTPGLESPTVAPLADPDWVAVRAMVPRKEANQVMDELSALGTKAILASDIRSCRL
jgi:ATP phosphoribosyltransferase